VTPSPGQRLLSPRAARTFYNAADALVPPGPGGEPGAGDLDLVPELEQRLRFEGVGAVRRLWLLLAILEAQPLATLRARRGFSWLPREERRRILDAWRRSRIAARRRAVEGLAALVEGCYAAETPRLRIQTRRRTSPGSPPADPPTP
jgi:hypothetical protein